MGKSYTVQFIVAGSAPEIRAVPPLPQHHRSMGGRKPVLYPAELRAPARCAAGSPNRSPSYRRARVADPKILLLLLEVVPRGGIEPPTPPLPRACSTSELPRRNARESGRNMPPAPPHGKTAGKTFVTALGRRPP